MLSNHVIGNHKFVLFVDNVGMERNSERILEKLLSEQNVVYEKFNGNPEIIKSQDKISLILQPISKMNLDDQSSIASTIQTLKINKCVTQVFGWATSKNIGNHLTIPFLEHMSSVVVTIKSESVLSILTKRKFGSVKFKEYQHELTRGLTSIKEMKHEKAKTTSTEPTINPETIGTFKIGEFSDNELEARKNLKLPFEIIDLPNDSQQGKKEGKIIYAHDRCKVFKCAHRAVANVSDLFQCGRF